MYLDVDNSGTITAEEMFTRANELGMKITLQQVRPASVTKAAQ